MNKTSLRVAGLQFPPYGIVYKENGEWVQDGFIEFKQLARAVKSVNSKIIYSGEQGYGEEYSHGNWSGALGKLITGEADVIASVYPASESIFGFMEFSPALFFNTFGVLSGPGLLTTKEIKVPIQLYNDTLTFAIVLGLWIAVTLLYHNAPSQTAERKTGWQRSQSFILSAVQFFGVMFLRGFPRSPVELFKRIVVAMWLLYCIVLSTAVSTGLSAKLAIRQVPIRIEKISDLVNFPDLLVVTFKNFFFQNYMKNPHPELEWLKERIQSIPMEKLMVPHKVYQFMKGEGVMITNKPLGTGTVASFLCMLVPRAYHVGKEDFNPTPLIVPYRKGLGIEIAENINVGVLRLAEMDVVGDMNRRYLRKAEECFKDVSAPSEVPVLLYQLESAIHIWCLALAAAFFLLIAEIVFKKVFELSERITEDKSNLRQESYNQRIFRQNFGLRTRLV